MRLNDLHESRVFPISAAVNHIFSGLAARFNQGDTASEIITINGKKILVTFDATMQDLGKHRWNQEHDLDEIVIGPSIINDPEMIHDTLVHEYTHMVDPGSKFHGTIGKSGKDYWGHPAEFNALSNEIIHNIVRHLSNLKENDPDGLMLFLDRLNMLLRYPKIFTDWTQFSDKIADWWEDNPKLWRMFKLRLYNAIQDEMKVSNTSDNARTDLLNDLEYKDGLPEYNFDILPADDGDADDVL